MRAAIAQTIVVGDALRPRRLWNDTTRDWRQKLPGVVAVRAVSYGEISQTRVMLTVCNMGGELVTIDAGWFEEPEPQMALI